MNYLRRYRKDILWRRLPALQPVSTDSFFGGVRIWIVIVVVLVIMTAGGLVSWTTLHGTPRATTTPTTRHMTKPHGHQGKTHSTKRTRTRTHGHGELSLTLKSWTFKGNLAMSDSNGFFQPLANVSTSEMDPGQDNYYVTITNDGRIPLTHLSIVFDIAPYPFPGLSIGFMLPGLPDVAPLPSSDNPVCPSSIPSDGQFVCSLPFEHGLMAPGKSRIYDLGLQLQVVPPSQALPSAFTIHATVRAQASNGSAAEATAPPLIKKVFRVDYNKDLQVHLSFQPSTVAPNQIFIMTVTLTNNGTAPIGNLVVSAPETPQGNPDPQAGLHNFNTTNCGGQDFAVQMCSPAQSQTLAPGASETMEFGEIIPGPSYPGIDHAAPSILTKQYPGQVYASGTSPQAFADTVWASTTGYVNLS